MRLSRRENDIVLHKIPKWLVEPPTIIKGRRVLIVDEICDSCKTLLMVKQKVETLKAKAIKSVVLYAHTQGVLVPDYIGIISDALILNPWYREIYRGKKFQFHPEYIEALKKQKLSLAHLG